MLVPILVKLYYSKRKTFTIVVIMLFISAFIIQGIVVLANDLNVSYFTYQDAYWTILYVKPYYRITQFLIGLCSGCFYFSYEREWENPSWSTIMLAKVKTCGNCAFYLLNTFGLSLMVSMMVFLNVVNSLPEKIP